MNSITIYYREVEVGGELRVVAAWQSPSLSYPCVYMYINEQEMRNQTQSMARAGVNLKYQDEALND